MEIWKPVVGYEGWYEVSNYGRVRSVDRFVNSKNDSLRMSKGHILKPTKKRNGYLVVSLMENNISKTIAIHRLVASAFCKRHDNDTQVNHINCIKTDNRAENLEWCTENENREHAHSHDLYKAPNKSPVRCKQTGMIFQSSFEAAEWLNENIYHNAKQIKNMAAKIRQARLGYRKVAYGYTWERA